MTFDILILRWGKHRSKHIAEPLLKGAFLLTYRNIFSLHMKMHIVFIKTMAKLWYTEHNECPFSYLQ